MNSRQCQDVLKSGRLRYQRRWRRIDKFMDWYKAERDRVARGVSDTDSEDMEEIVVETNYPFAWVDTMTSTVCPTNPQITITASNPDMVEVAKRRETLANDTMRRNKLYKRAKRSAAHAAIAGFGMTKTVWKFSSSGGRPKTSSINPRRVIWDETVEDWEDIAFIAEATLLRKDQFEARARKRRAGPDGTEVFHYNQEVASKAVFGNRPRWIGEDDFFQSDDVEAPTSAIQYVVVWEFYDFTEDKYFHLLDSVDEPLLESDLPYVLVRNPYDIITFNDNLEDSTGISDVHLIENLQERLNEIDTLELNHAQSSIPITIIDTNAVDNPEGFSDGILNADGPGSVIEAKLKGGKGLKEAIGVTPTPQLPISWDKMRSEVKQKIEFILGLPSFMRGGVGEMKIATEGMLADSALRTRNGSRKRVMDEWTATIAFKIIALYAEMHNPKDPIPVRTPGTRQGELLDYDEFGFDDPSTFEEDWWFEYDASPHSPTENSATVQLQRLQQFLPVLMQSPDVDARKTVLKLLDLLMLREVAADAPQAPTPVPGQPGVAGGGGQPGLSGMSGNDLPPENQPTGQAIQPDLQSKLQEMLRDGQPPAPGVSVPPVEGF